MNAPKLIDARFLTPHPRTVLWLQERRQCEACAHLIRPPVEDHQAMRCAVSPILERRGRPGKSDCSFCIDARDEGRSCGPDARLFSPRG